MNLKDSYLMFYTEIENEEFSKENENVEIVDDAENLENMDWQEVVRKKRKYGEEKHTEVKRKRREEERKKHTEDHNNPKFDNKKQKSDIFLDDDKTTSEDKDKSQDLEGEVKWTEEDRKNHKVGHNKKQNNEKKEGVKATETRKYTERNGCSEDIEGDVVDLRKAKKVKYIAWFTFHVTIATFTPQIMY